MFAIAGFNFLGIITLAAASIWVSIALLMAIDQQVAGKKPDMRNIGKRAWKLFFPYVVISLLIALIMIGLSLTAIPGIVLMGFAAFSESMGAAMGILGVLLFFVGAIAALVLIAKFSVELAFTQYNLVLTRENKPWNKLTSTLSESRSLVKGRWWATFIRLFVPNIVFSLIVFGINLAVGLGTTVLFAVAVGLLSESVLQVGAAISTLFVMLISALAVPLYTLATYFLYDSLTKGK
jgi:hypothetical protein